MGPLHPFTFSPLCLGSALMLQRLHGGIVEGGNLQRIVKTSLYLFFETFVGIGTWIFKEFLVLFHLNMQV